MQLRPGRRLPGLLLAAMVIYFFATNSGVVWMYLLTALVLALVPIGIAAPLLAVRGVRLRAAGVDSRGFEPPLRSDRARVFAGDRLALRVDASGNLDACEFGPLLLAGGERRPAGRSANVIETDAGARGLLQVEAIRASSSWPVGVFTVSSWLSLPCRVIVNPRYCLPPQGQRAGTREPIGASSRRGQGDQFLGLRRYQPGDSQRRIHWPTVAKAGELMVVDTASEANSPGVFRLSIDGDAGPPSADLAVEATASLLAACVADGSSFVLDIGQEGNPVGGWDDALTRLSLAGRGTKGIGRGSGHEHHGSYRWCGHRDRRQGSAAGSGSFPGRAPGDPRGDRVRRWAASGSIPEESALARLSVLLAAAAANIGVAVEAGVLWTALSCLMVIALGHYTSWRGRHRPRTRSGQVFLGLLLVGCIAYVVADLVLGIFGGALPQAKFALLAQAVTAFDLKSRRNLFTHIWHSAVILYVGALFAWTPAYVVFVLAWALGFFGFLLFTHRRKGVGSAPGKLLPRLRGSMRGVGPWLGCWLVLAGLAFIALPRFAGRPTAVPLLISIPIPDQASPELLPAVLPLVGTDLGPGTERSINLRARGRLGEQVMFRVRAPAASYWRAYTLEDYRGQSWVRLSRPARFIPPITADLPIDDEPPGQGGSLPQTFYIEQPLPAEVIASYPLRELYFPARELTLASTGTVRAPFGLGRGVNYSAVSTVRDFSPGALRDAAPVGVSDALTADVTLPQSLPARVKDLADGLVGGRSTEYDQVAAITQYLRSNYRYSLDTPRLPAGADAVDQFLFVDHVGFCEQFASALTVLLRAEHIPSRLAVGWATGEHDNFTGTFTVKAHDAHAWVEVLFPGKGWMPFDASPGFPSEPAAQEPLRWLLSDFSPQLALSSLGSGGRLALGAGVGLMVVAALAALAALVLRRKRLPPPLRVYQRSQRWLRWGGLPARARWQTPAEHLARLETVSEPAARALVPLSLRVEAVVYAGADPRRAGSSLPVLVEALQHRLRGRRERRR